MSEPIHIISLGAGVQSSVMAKMGDEGIITPKPVAGIFSDTKWERLQTILWLAVLEKMLSFPIYKVSKGNLKQEILKRRINRKTGKPYYSTYIPAFVKTPTGRGILLRKCTHDFKILELIKKQKEIIGKQVMRQWRRKHKDALKQLREWKQQCALAKKQKMPQPLRPALAWADCQSDPLAIIWIGISTDEASRMKDSKEPWAIHRYPLIELRMNRAACLKWMKDRGYPKPPKSACIACPYHDDEQWRDIKETTPDEFAEAVKFEKDFQRVCADGGAREVPFLHDSLIPLDQVDFSRPSHEQANLFNNECEGMCGVWAPTAFADVATARWSQRKCLSA